MDLARKVDFKDGAIEYNSFNIDFSKPLEDQVWELNEDLLQVTYLKGDIRYTLDVGWYPSHQTDFNSGLVVMLLKNQDWENPLFTGKCRSEIELIRCVRSAINLIP